MIDLWNLKVGDGLETRDRAAAEVAGETQDSEWIKVLYIEGESKRDAWIVGTEGLCHENDVTFVTHSRSSMLYL